MRVTAIFKASDRAAWRAWLAENHATAAEIWLIFDDRTEIATVSYLDAVEEALCFGWIDSIQKRISPVERAQRFSPRKPGGNWTELNKERARRLIRLGLMTASGAKTLPDLNAAFVVSDDILRALQAEPVAWSNFLAFPELYRRVRIGYIENARRDPTEFARRLSSFVEKTAANKMFGSWNDSGRLA